MEARAKILQMKADPEVLHIGVQELFIYFPDGMGKSKLSMPSLERAAKSAITTRNWTTVTELLRMVSEET